MSKEELSKLKASELADMCKERGIPHYRGKNRFRKDELIEAILKEQEQAVVESTTEQYEEKIEEASVVVKEEKATSEVQIDENKEQYLQNIKVGTLVAFREYNGKLNTAAVHNVSFKRRQLRLITQYEKEFIISFNDVVWVRTKKRWPKFVFDELKQRGTNNDTVK